MLIADLTDNLQYFTFGFAADIKSRAGTNASWLQEHSVEVAEAGRAPEAAFPVYRPLSVFDPG